MLTRKPVSGRRTAIESIAVANDGDVAAWTCLVAAADPARAAQIEGTLVLASHRGRGLGLVVKTDCLRAARALGVASVRTSSDDANVWMRSINTDLGFAPVEAEVIVQRLRESDT